MATDASIQASIVQRGGRSVAVINAGTELIAQPVRAQKFLDAVRELFFNGNDAVLIGLDGTGRLATFGPPNLVAIVHDMDPKRMKWSRYRLKGTDGATTTASTSAA